MRAAARRPKGRSESSLRDIGVVAVAMNVRPWLSRAGGWALRREWRLDVD
jgi:hypothetical protein